MGNLQELPHQHPCSAGHRGSQSQTLLLAHFQALAIALAADLANPDGEEMGTRLYPGVKSVVNCGTHAMQMYEAWLLGSSRVPAQPACEGLLRGSP